MLVKDAREVRSVKERKGKKKKKKKETGRGARQVKAGGIRTEVRGKSHPSSPFPPPPRRRVDERGEGKKELSKRRSNDMQRTPAL